jgi:HD-GYP domain-containing protein (c-di-GMP phosphodiesterase class II)
MSALPDAEAAPVAQLPQVESLDEAVQFFAALLLGALRNGLIYSPTHSHFHHAVAKTEQMAGMAFAFSPEIVFICLEKELFFGGKPMNRRGMQFQRLADFMHSLGIQRLQVRRGLTLEEVKAFALNLIGLSDTGEPTGKKRIVATPHIRVGRLKCPDAGAGMPAGVPTSSPGRGEDEKSATGSPAGLPDVPALPAPGLGVVAAPDPSREMAACEAVLGLVAGLGRHAGYLFLAAALHRHHAATYRHSVNVALLAATHARMMQAPPDVARGALIAGLLHDLGKLAVPPEILEKPEPRSPDDERIYRQHCAAGALLLARYPAVPPLAVIAAFEHHLFAGGDGGYPGCPRGAPHVVSQLVGLADWYDAATQASPGQALPTREAILERLRQETPHRFRPDLVASFPAALDAFEPPRG